MTRAVAKAPNPPSEGRGVNDFEGLIFLQETRNNMLLNIFEFDRVPIFFATSALLYLV